MSTSYPFGECLSLSFSLELLMPQILFSLDTYIVLDVPLNHPGKINAADSHFFPADQTPYLIDTNL